MKTKFIALFMGLTIIFSLFPCVKVSAWSYEEDNYTEDGFWIVDNSSNNSAIIELHMCVPKKDKNAMYAGGNYDFLCLDGDFPDGKKTGTLYFKYFTENKTVVAEGDDYEIWTFQFTVEPGAYEFANNLSNEICEEDNLYVLDENLEFHNEIPSNWGEYIDNPQEFYYEKRILEANSITRIYALRCFDNSSIENFDHYMEILIDYAYKKEEQITREKNGDGLIISPKDDETKEITPLKFVDNSPVKTENVSDSDVKVILKEADVIEEEKSDNFVSIIKSAVCVLILGVLGFVVGKTKKKRY